MVPDGHGAELHELVPEKGFEPFITEILNVIDRTGKGAFYVFDCLSDLSVEWYSDRMLGNFFMLACPYLYTYGTVAYFALLRDCHSQFAIEAVHGTSQVVIDVYRKEDRVYVYPLKVEGRRSPTMYMLHSWEGDDFHPVLDSATTAEVLSDNAQLWLDHPIQQQDIWTRSFGMAREMIKADAMPMSDGQTCDLLFSRLVRMAVTRDTRLLRMAERYLCLRDVVGIGERMIGTGPIGGKSAGMLLARAILERSDARWKDWLEPHDSFYIGSDVYYTYLTINGCWWVRRRLNEPSSGFLMDQKDRARLLSGRFPKEIEDSFRKMLAYFGQSPIIVRSSSLLEDAYGNAFSGKYESVFLSNQGSPEERLERFMDAVRRVYASTLSKEALEYRARRGLLDRDEQMAVLVQRVSGSWHGDIFFPHVAGVGLSYNPYIWSEAIDPKAGVVRLVFGLGTRAVERVDDDYTRIVALNEPLRRPEGDSEEVRRYAQRRCDVIDTKTGGLRSLSFEEVVRLVPDLPLETLAIRDPYLEERVGEDWGGGEVLSWTLTFDGLLSRGGFVDRMRMMMRSLEEAYEHPVDIEFTVNFDDAGEMRINLLQCRPFQAREDARSVSATCDPSSERILLRAVGHLIGGSRTVAVDRIIWIVPKAYGEMRMSERYSVARIVGKLTHLKDLGEMPVILLAGPGRWATTSPELGVPVSFSDINTVSILCEIIAMHEGLVPEPSLGTHFFNDLVESDMLYLAVHPEKEGNLIDVEFFERAENRLASVLPEAKRFDRVIKVLDAVDQRFRACSDALGRTFTLYAGPK